MLQRKLAEKKTRLNECYEQSKSTLRKCKSNGTLKQFTTQQLGYLKPKSKSTLRKCKSNITLTLKTSYQL